jgi:hypothetical protein
MATGSGASNSSRIASGSVAGSIGTLPGSGGTSRGDPGPVTGGNGGGCGGELFVFDMWVARFLIYRPSALALSAS